MSTLKEFRGILLAHEITVYTDHKNLTNNFFKYRTCNMLAPNNQKFDPELKCIKRKNNVVVDALYCLEISDNQDILNISEIYGYDDKDLPNSAYPFRYQDIAKAQKTYAKLQQKLVSHKDYNLDTFCGGNKNHRLICRNIKICTPAAL